MKNFTSDRIIYFGLLFLSFIFIFLFSRGTSPLFDFYGYDSAIFITIGDAILNGKVPYVDIFDHKGPALFFVEAFAQLFVKGRQGVFIFQVFCFSWVLFFLWKSVRIFTTSLLSIITSIFMFLLFFRFTITEGNLTEEYSLPFIFISLYIVLRFYFEKKKLSLWQMFVLGVCFAVPFWMRANNVGAICANIIFASIVFCQHKDYKMLLNLTLMCTLGVVAVSLPIIAYFVYHDALNEMLYATFTFNVKYALIPDLLSPENAKYYPIFIFFATLALLVGTYLYYKKSKDKNIFILTTLLLLFVIVPLFITPVDRMLLHYMTLTLPVLMVGVMLFLKAMEGTRFVGKATQIMALSVLVIALVGSFGFRYEKFKNIDTKYVEVSRAITKHIPDDEKSSVYVYMGSYCFYQVTGIKPIYKYFVTQEFHARVDPHILTDINTMMKTRKPLWVMTEVKSLDKLRNKEMKNILESNYYLYDRKTDGNRTLSLYRLK